MKAQIKPRKNLEGRTALETVIPLETPFFCSSIPPAPAISQCTFFCPPAIAT